MDYYSQPNNNENQRNSVNTRGTMYKDINCKFPMALEIGFSDDLITLTFTPPLPDQERVKGQKLFDYKNQIRSGMSRIKAHELYVAYNSFIVPALREGQGKFVGVRLASGKHVIGVDTGVDLFKDGNTHPCLILIRNVKEDGKSDDVLVYEFNKTELLVDYNPSTGVTKETKVLDSEFDLFMQDLESARDGSSKAYIHAARQVDNRYKTLLTDYLKGIAQKVGAPIPSSNGNSYNGGSNPYRGANIFDTGEGATGDDEGLPFDDMPKPAPSATISDMEQLAAELGM
ncbi:MAG: hypothetical protein NC548_29655 [Lachnospiraceae bacterium]|nr:hypothetical protein [Lachnospiraceae bacterium]